MALTYVDTKSVSCVQWSGSLQEVLVKHLSKRHLLGQSQKRKHQDNEWSFLKVNNKDNFY